MPNINDGPLGMFTLFPIKWTTASMSVGTMTAGWITGSPIVVLNNSGATPGTQTTRTATELIADGNLQKGQTWLIAIFNSVTTNALTVGAGVGVTLAGAAQTVAGFSCRLWQATVMDVTTPAITMTALFAFGAATNFAAIA